MKRLFIFIATVFITTCVFAQIPKTGKGDGLKGSYWYGSPDFGNPIPDGSKGGENYAASVDFAGNAYLTKPGTHEFDRIDPQIDFDWGVGNPFNDLQDGADGQQHCFSILWTGYILSPITGDVCIDLTHCDDAFSLEVWDSEDMTSSIAKYDKEYLTGWNWDKDFWTIPVAMEEGHFYYVELKYFDTAWGAHITMKWFNEEYSTEAETIPQEQLYSKLPDTDGIKEFTNSKSKGEVYNLNGIRVSGKPQPGFYIRNGKKFLVK